MRIWMLLQGNRGDGDQRVELFLFKRSAMSKAKRILANGGNWKLVDDHGTSATHFWITSAVWMSVVGLPLQFTDLSIRRWIHERCHWQNLNENRLGEVKGSIIRHGRAWFRFRKDDYNGPSLHWSWNFGWRNWFGFSLDMFDGDSNHDVGFSFHLGLAHFWLTFENVLSKRYGYPRHNWTHTWGITLYGDHLQLRIHDAYSDCFVCKGWKGWRWSTFVTDRLLGSATYSKRVIETHQATVPMPEASYSATVTIQEETWKRPRWFARRRLGSSIEVAGGVPVPGKGENSWDCGEDAIYSTGSSEPTVASAVAQLVKSALETRERHGGRDWRPSEKVAV